MRIVVSLLKSPRLWGLTGTALVLYFLIFVVLGKIDVSGIMPDTNRMARSLMENWPRLPFFAVQKTPVDRNGGQEIYYTVPTRQLTPRELARMGATNATPHPAVPK